MEMRRKFEIVSPRNNNKDKKCTSSRRKPKLSNLYWGVSVNANAFWWAKHS